MTDAVAVAVGFARTLRAAGLPVGGDRVAAYTSSLAALDCARRDDVYWAGRLTMCAAPDDVLVYDRAFAAYFSADDPLRSARRGAAARTPARRQVAELASVDPEGEESSSDGSGAVLAAASRTERLRTADLGSLGEGDRSEAHRLIDRLRADPESRRTRRWQVARTGAVDRRATVRSLLTAGGEVGDLRRRRHRRRPRSLVLLVDVSGSMQPYAVGLLRFAHAAVHRGAPTEVFSLGTRLTRLTDELGHRDPDRAMAAVGSRIADWSGGTRLGVLLREWLDGAGRRGMARGAVVVVLSDGWERDDPALLGVQMQRLARLAHRVVWANPRRARPGFAPVAGGMAAALPFVDDFVDGHSVAALEHLADVIAGVRHREAVAGRRGFGPAGLAGGRHA